MARLRPYPVTVFSGVTLFIWGNRVWLNWTAKDVDLAAKLALSIPITCFVVVSVVLLVAMWRGIDRRSTAFRGAVTVFAGGTTLFWLVRLPMILAHHHPAGFKVVHSVLAVASVAAAFFAWRSLDAAGAEVEAPAEPLVDTPA